MMQKCHGSLGIIYFIMVLFICGCGLSENKAKEIINLKIDDKSKKVTFIVKNDEATKVFKYMVENNHIEELPFKSNYIGDKQYKIFPENGVIFFTGDETIITHKNRKTGEYYFKVDLHVHPYVIKINEMVFNPEKNKTVVKYKAGYKIIKQNDSLWSWCEKNKNCGADLREYLNSEADAEITLIKSSEGWG